jgi:hypothetical protein
MRTYTHLLTNTLIHHNGDLSGDVIIRDRHGREVEIPGAAMLEFVAHYVRRERISKLEQATTDEILGLK